MVFVVLIEFVSENNHAWLSLSKLKKKTFIGLIRSISFFKFNILILERVIKEMVTLQQEKDKHSA